MSSRSKKDKLCGSSSCGQEAKKSCGSCKAIYYCSTECQKTDWETVHRKNCKEMGLNKLNGVKKNTKESKENISNVKQTEEQQIGTFFLGLDAGHSNSKRYLLDYIDSAIEKYPANLKELQNVHNQEKKELRDKEIFVIMDDLLLAVNNVEEQNGALFQNIPSTKVPENDVDNDDDDNMKTDSAHEELSSMKKIDSIKTLQDVAKTWEQMYSLLKTNPIAEKKVEEFNSTRVSITENGLNYILFPMQFIRSETLTILKEEDLPFFAKFVGKILLLYADKTQQPPEKTEFEFDEETLSTVPFITNGNNEYKFLLEMLVLKYDSVDMLNAFKIIYSKLFETQFMRKTSNSFSGDIVSIPNVLGKMFDDGVVIQIQNWKLYENAKVLWKKKNAIPIQELFLYYSLESRFPQVSIFSDPEFLEDVLLNTNSRLEGFNKPIDLGNKDFTETFTSTFDFIVENGYYQAISIFLKYGFKDSQLDKKTYIYLILSNKHVNDQLKIVTINELLKYKLTNLFKNQDLDGQTNDNVFHYCKTKKMAVYFIEKILELFKKPEEVKITDRKILNDPKLLEKAKQNLKTNASEYYKNDLSEKENLRNGKKKILEMLEQSFNLTPKEYILSNSENFPELSTKPKSYPVVLSQSEKLFKEYEEASKYLDEIEHEYKLDLILNRNEEKQVEVEKDLEEKLQSNAQTETEYKVLVYKVEKFKTEEKELEETFNRLLQMRIDVGNMSVINSDLLWFDILYQKPLGLEDVPVAHQGLARLRPQEFYYSNHNSHFRPSLVSRLTMLQQTYKDPNKHEFAFKLLEYLPGGKYHAALIKSKENIVYDENFVLPEEAILTPFVAFQLMTVQYLIPRMDFEETEAKLFLTKYGLDLYPDFTIKNLEKKNYIYMYILNQIFRTNKAFVKMIIEQINYFLKDVDYLGGGSRFSPAMDLQGVFERHLINRYFYIVRAFFPEIFTTRFIQYSKSLFIDFETTLNDIYKYNITDVVDTNDVEMMRYLTKYRPEFTGVVYTNKDLQTIPRKKRTSLLNYFIKSDSPATQLTPRNNGMSFQMFIVINQNIYVDWLKFLNPLRSKSYYHIDGGNSMSSMHSVINNPLITNLILSAKLSPLLKDDYEKTINEVLLKWAKYNYKLIITMKIRQAEKKTPLDNLKIIFFKMKNPKNNLEGVVSAAIGNRYGGEIFLEALKIFSELNDANKEIIREKFNEKKDDLYPILEATYQNYEIFLLVLQCGADPNVISSTIDSQSIKGKTALHIASKSGKSQFVRALLTFGADRTIRDDQGKLASDYAKAKTVKDAFENPNVSLKPPRRPRKTAASKKRRSNNDDDDDNDDEKEKNEDEIDEDDKDEDTDEKKDEDEDEDKDDKVIVQKEKKKKVKCELCEIELPEQEEGAKPYRFCSTECKLAALNLSSSN